MKKLIASFGVIFSLMLAVSGCSSNSPVSYESVADLKTAFESAGGSCLEWVQTNQVEAALESGTCNSSTVLSVYVDAESAETAATNLVQLINSFGMEPNVIYGANWVVNSDQVDIVSGVLNGKKVIN